jgi:hypothetical protein
VHIKCVLSDVAKIAASLDMYRNFFAVLVWHRRPLGDDFVIERTKETWGARQHGEIYSNIREDSLCGNY